MFIQSATYSVQSVLQCSVQCGEGSQMRKVTCRTHSHHAYRTLPDRHCNATTRPAATRICQRHSCRSHVTWRYSAWAEVRVCINKTYKKVTAELTALKSTMKGEDGEASVRKRKKSIFQVKLFVRNGEVGGCTCTLFFKSHGGLHFLPSKCANAVL